MIVHHRPEDAGGPTEYTMAMHRTDFILLHELVKMKITELQPIGRTDEAVVSFFALLRVMGASMQAATVQSIPLPETLRRISMFPPGEEPESVRHVTRQRRRKAERQEIRFKEEDQ